MKIGTKVRIKKENYHDQLSNKKAIIIWIGHAQPLYLLLFQELTGLTYSTSIFPQYARYLYLAYENEFEKI